MRRDQKYHQQSALMIGVVGARIHNIVQHLRLVHAIPFADFHQSFRSKSTFRVNVDAFSFAAAQVHGELTRDGERMAELGLAGSELAKQFRDASGLDSAAQKLV